MIINKNLNVPYSINFASSKNKKATPIYKETSDCLSFTPVSEYYCVKPYYLERKGELLSDTKEFSKYLESKIKKQMMVQSEQDVQNTIDNVVKDTKADAKLVSEVLGRVVQFSSFKQLQEIADYLSDKEVSSIAFTNSLNLNSDFHYIFHEKRLCDLQVQDKHSALFIDYDNFGFVQKEIDDEAFHQQQVAETSKRLDDKYGKEFSVEKLIASKNMLFSPTTEHYPVKFFIVDGWNYRKDGQTKSYTMLGSENNLEDTVKTIVNEVQETGKSVDEVLNGEIISSLKNRFGEDFEVDIVKNNKLTDYSAKTISEIMAPNYPTAEEIEKFIDLVVNAEYTRCDVYASIQDRRKLVSAYLDSMIDCYSPQRLDVELKKKYEAIEKKVKSLGKSMDDVYYLVPNTDKSFAMISRQFAKVNNVDSMKLLSPEKIIGDKKYQFLENGGKVAVVLDDFYGSGDSVVEYQFSYEKFLKQIEGSQGKDNDVNIIFAPIVTTRKAKKYIDAGIVYLGRVGKDFILPNKVISSAMVAQDHFNQGEVSNMFRLLGGSGYGYCATANSFPTAIPDNDSTLSRLVLSRTLQNGFALPLFKQKTLDCWTYPITYKTFEEAITGGENENK